LMGSHKKFVRNLKSACSTTWCSWRTWWLWFDRYNRKQQQQWIDTKSW
jgi:hypothetical protein